MNKNELDKLYDRLNELPVSHQAFILAGVYGILSGHSQNGSEIAKDILKDISECVTRWENKKSAK